MNGHPVLDVGAVILAWMASAMLTVALSNIPIPRSKPEIPVEQLQTKTISAQPQTVKQQVVEIEKKLDKAEDDLEEIARIIALKQAIEKAEALNKADDSRVQ